MADPFSAATGAIGIISLGLQVAQQLVTYCQAYQSYDEDAQRIKSRAEGLQRPLRALGEIIEDARVSNPELATDLAEKALGLQRMVNRLKETVDQHLPIIPDKFPKKIKGQLKRAIYPFRRDSLRGIIDDLDCIQNALQTSLILLSLQGNIRQTLMHRATYQEVLQMCIAQQENLKVMPPPSLLKAWCESQINYKQSVEDMHHMSNVTLAASGNSNSETTNYADSTLSCRTSNSRGKTDTSTKSFKYLSSFLRVAVTASLTLSNGAGGYSIAPTLNLQTIREYDGRFLELTLMHLPSSKMLTASDFDRAIEDCIRQVQRAFADGKAAPSDIFYHKYCPSDYATTSIVDALVPYSSVTKRFQLPGLNKLTRFLVSSGALPNNSSKQGVLKSLIGFTYFRDEEYLLASYLVEHGGPLVLDDGLLNHVERHNVKYILLRNDDLIVVPEIAKIILQKSDQKLRDGLKSGYISPNTKVCGCSLLQLAFGWPTGMQILLRSGAIVEGSLIQSWGCPSPLAEEDVDCKCFFDSTRLLLEAGCDMKIPLLQAAGSGQLLSLFVSELAQRRWRLWKLAQSCLPQRRLGEFGLNQGTVPDLHASEISAAIVARGNTIDRSLLVMTQDASIYHHRTLSPRVMEELLKMGFKDFDSPSSTGLTPLMVTYDSYFGWQAMARVAWFISKGADVNRRLPRSSAKVSHLITVQIVGFLLALLDYQRSDVINTHWSRWENRISQYRGRIFASMSIIDSCSCACSPHGCTNVSVALRQALRWDRWLQVADRSFWFRHLLYSLTDWARFEPWVNRALIRCLTFDALGLKHTCCIEIDGVVGLLDRRDATEMQGRDHGEITEILEEDAQTIEKHKQLVIDFEAKFDELGLSILEFLEGYWHTHMVEYLLGGDPYNEDHDVGARSMGVFLQAEENVLDRVSLLIGAQVKEVGGMRTVGVW
ncbi:uncharacterized protein N7482_006915 [Penicillium canariense]|uniref:Fungal N-terminal domain-containing protein n=1 Tax=Penicillium canariense TaxID=189055 RepID=A0A9W9HY40_9EURO|nr:uncharacterized protein N7482_006915 [Penicillium canariense]KAJ5159911.1 hypothetical protein N7482_006915 [Penicillium canariense]